MSPTLCAVVDNVVNFLSSASRQLGIDMLFVIGLAVEALLVIFFLIKSAVSYEATLNRALDKINYWLFEKKNVTEENIKDLNQLFKTKAPKRVCYYWQQYILFREGNPSEYLSVENLIEKPLKTSSYNSNIKNLSIFTIIWALIASTFILISQVLETNVPITGSIIVRALLLALGICIIGIVFIVFMRARKNAVLNTLYQNVSLFGRFMDNACVDLPSYIDYQILFTPKEIEKGQPVLREFLDFKARKEKEEFNKAKEEQIDYVTYDFSETGVDGSVVLDRAMRESELFLKKKEKILVQISQLEAELDSRKKNFDNIQKESQTKIQASKENIIKLRQMQEETTNRIESNYYRKQQTQEAAKQEQLEQEFEQQRTKYLLEKSECEEEIKKLNDQLEGYRKDVENAMIIEYKSFFDKFCHSAEKVVEKAFGEKLNSLKEENAKDKETITNLEIKLKNAPEAQQQDSQEQGAEGGNSDIPPEGKYDENGNYVYPNGTYYDPNGNFHDEHGNVYSQDGQLISEAPAEEKKEEKQVVNFDNFDTFDFMTDVSQKDDIYGVAENVVKNLDTENELEIINTKSKEEEKPAVEEETNVEPQQVEPQQENAPKTETANAELEDFSLEEPAEETKPVEQKTAPATPKKKAGRPRKVVASEPVKKTPGKRGRPRKIVSTPQNSTSEPAKRSVGRPRKTAQPTTATEQPVKRKVGRPKKIVKEEVPQEPKRGRGRPKKQMESIYEINKKLTEEEAKLAEMRKALNKELEAAVNDMDSSDDSQEKREELLHEIDSLQAEAQNAIKTNQSSAKIEEINAKLESLLEEVKKLNS